MLAMLLTISNACDRFSFVHVNFIVYLLGKNIYIIDNSNKGCGRSGKVENAMEKLRKKFVDKKRDCCGVFVDKTRETKRGVESVLIS